ncbi:response regulator transcription factor [Leifsonia sp. NPDC056824]|uniref:response regulator transcription factor n=1 Tax=Leifsonia sp. NPDC056824 TaxID=3345953 RepID=UPI0036A8F633
MRWGRSAGAIMDVRAQVLSVSYDVDGVAGRDARVHAIAESLDVILPSEHSGWADIGSLPGDVTLIARYGPERVVVVDAVKRTADAHPTMLAFRSRPRSVDPVRLSDRIELREWRRHPVYSELFSLLGTTYQIALPVQPLATGRLRTWVFNRADRDFGDDELELARRLQPLLAAVDTVAVAPRPSVASAAFAARSGLTAREAQILGMLGSGMTATSIAYVTRVSPRTVQKHIEHIYAKLGVHDRVSAALLAADRLGRP